VNAQPYPYGRPSTARRFPPPAFYASCAPGCQVSPRRLARHLPECGLDVAPRPARGRLVVPAVPLTQTPRSPELARMVERVARDLAEWRP
jgi:hypothetical protein